MATDFRYTRAIVRGVPASLPPSAQRLDQSGEPIDLEKARKQHAAYTATLKQLGLKITEIAADEALPDCVFVEDAAVCVDNTALVCNLGHKSRQPEAVAMRETLKSLGFDIVNMQEPARLDGGDVLFTGREFFVGVSTRSNSEGADALANAFPSFPVSTVQVDEHLHLKSMMTMIGKDAIVVGDSEMARGSWNELSSKAKFKYEKVTVAEDKAANCLFINGTVVHLVPQEIPKSISTYRELTCSRIELGNSELHKVDGCLTCASILLK